MSRPWWMDPPNRAREIRDVTYHAAVGPTGRVYPMEPLQRYVQTEESDMDTTKKIRWTITGEGAPLGDREHTWAAVSELIALAQSEEVGLRVEVAEVEEETR